MYQTAVDNNVIILAKEAVVLQVGKSRLVMDKDGNILLEGENIVIKGDTRVDINPNRTL